MSAAHLETVACPYCASSAHSHWASENGFAAVKCQSCGLVYVTPRPSLNAISEATRLGEHQLESGTLAVAYNRSARKLRNYRRLIAGNFRKELAAGKPIRWLDIGAGFGELIEALGQVLPEGSRVTGIEPMAQKVASAQARGLDVRSDSLADIQDQFDVVSMVNILSHIPDPDIFLAEVARLVRPGGTLYLFTGNGGDLESRSDYPDVLDLPDHLLFAGEKHIRGFLERQGLAVELVHRRRKDTVSWSLKNLAKRAIGRSGKFILPYRSGFRDVAFKGHKPETSIAS